MSIILKVFGILFVLLGTLGFLLYPTSWPRTTMIIVFGLVLFAIGQISTDLSAIRNRVDKRTTR